MATGLGVRLLGRVAVVGEHGLVEPPPRTHGLLALLVLSPGGLARGEAATLVAPGREGSQARRRLSRLLWLLQDAAPDLGVTATSQWIELDPPITSVDVGAFEERARSGAPEDLERAFALWTGTLCPASDLPWVERRRARLEALARRVARDVAEARLRRGDQPGARAAADVLLAHAPSSSTALDLRTRVDRSLDPAGGAPSTPLDAPGLSSLRDGRAAEVLRTPSVAHVPAGPGDDAVAPAWLARARWAIDAADGTARREALARLRAAVSDGELDREALRVLEIREALARDELGLAERLFAMARERTAGLLACEARIARERPDLDAALVASRRALVEAYGTDGPDRRLALLAAAEVRSARGEGRDALAAASAAAERAREAGDLSDELEAEVLNGRELVRQGRTAAALALLQPARQHAAAAGLVRLEALALHEVGRGRCRHGDLPLAEALQREERDAWARIGLPTRQARACVEHATTLLRCGRHDEARAAARAGRDLANARAPRIADAAELQLGLVGLHRDGAAPAAVDHAEAAAARALASGEPELEAAGLLVRAFARYLAEAPAAALEDVLAARARHEARDERERLVLVCALEALVRLELGEVEASLEASAVGMETIVEGREHDLSLLLDYARARALLAAGRSEEAARWLEHGRTRLEAVAESLGMSAARLRARDPLTFALAATPAPVTERAAG